MGATLKHLFLFTFIVLISVQARATSSQSLDVFKCSKQTIQIVLAKNLDRPGYRLTVGIGRNLQPIATQLVYLPNKKVYIGRIDRLNSFTQNGFEPGYQVTIFVSDTIGSKMSLFTKNEKMYSSDEYALRWDDLPCRPAHLN